MSARHEGLAALFEAVWKDKALKKRLMNDPKGVLQDYSAQLPSIIDASSVDDCMHAPDCVHITLEGGACFCVRADPCADC